MGAILLIALLTFALIAGCGMLIDKFRGKKYN